MNVQTSSRRRLLQGLAVSAFGGIAGCAATSLFDHGGTPAENETQTTGITTEAADQSFVIALTKDPTRGQWGVYNGVTPYFTHVFEPLVGVSDDMKTEPLLATQWKATNEQTWVFKLREGVTFHNGEPLTADAVVYSFEQVFKQWGWAADWISLKPDGITVLDDLTVKFETTQPFPSFPGAISHNYFGIQHPNAEESGNAIGTGPFRVEHIKEGASVTVVPFEDYWRTDPHPSELTFRVIVDPTTRVLALEKGAVDIVFDVPPSKVPTVAEATETKTKLQLSPSADLVAVNLYKSPTDDDMLRDALNWAVDQRTIVDTILNGIGEPARGPFSRIIPWAIHEKLPTYGPDREKAARLVAQSDYAGQELSLLVNSDQSIHKTIAAVLKGWFEEIGVSTRIQLVNSSSFYATFTAGEANLAIVGFGSNSAASDYLVRSMFHSRGSDNRKLYKSEETGVYNPGPKVDRLIEKGYQAHTLEQKRKYYGEVQRRVLETGAIVPLYYKEYVLGKRANIASIDMHPINKMVGWNNLTRRK